MRRKNLKLGTDRNINKDDRGVSPVIAVILMVAITVVMAAIVSSWSAGVKAPTTPTTVGMDISRSTTNITLTITAIDPASSALIPKINISYKNSSGTQYAPEMSDVDVGASTEFNTTSSNLTQVIITAKFKDGSKKVLFTREV
ncbi:MAG: type IV pilin N-terminal domain-containing protein [Candidatus Methanoperedens sp.]|nr:type IV pilin N-terminal domain-containing protein [Candidatus Methanoperedens sp.]